MKMICCVSPTTGGDLLIEGKNVHHKQREIKSTLGVVSQADSLDPGLNVMQNLVAYARYFNLPREQTRVRCREVLSLFQLTERAAASLDELSGGMRRRLLIARALLHDPKILVLDEPTTGLDPQARLLVWEQLRSLKAGGITVLLTTHYMEEASYLCDRLVVMDEGKILAEGSPSDLIARHVGDQVVEVRVPLWEKDQLLARLTERSIDYDERGDQVFLFPKNGLLSADDASFASYEVTRRSGNLEDVFLRLTGRGLREE